MGRNKSILWGFLVLLLSWTSADAQEPYCKNLGFELGDFTNWKGYNWIYSASVPSVNTAKVQVALPTSRRQEIMTDVTATDANTGGILKKIPPGYAYSARLGDMITPGDPNPRCWQQSLKYTMTIDSTNALLVMKFALVLQYASDHSTPEEPRFRLSLFDQHGDTIPDCSNYDVYSTSGTVKGFEKYTPFGSNTPVQWRDWTTVGANLLKYYGQTVTIEFMTADCTRKYHYGYAYFVAACHPLYITVKYCAGDSEASLAAPEGFEQYRWKNSSGAIIDTTQKLNISNPVEGAVYTCQMISATGCDVSLRSVIAKYVLKTDFSSRMIDCSSNTVQFSNLSSTTHGSLTYLWDFGNGNRSTDANPKFTFGTSGMHEVNLTLNNPPSTCTEKIVRTIESFSPPLVGIMGYPTYCPGKNIYLKAYGAYAYNWSNGSKADSLKVGDPGGKYWLLGRSSTGCTSDTIYKIVSKDPDWEFADLSDTTLCKGERALLKVSGALRYLWSTGEKSDTISVTSPGIFQVMGANTRGCEKTRTFKVEEFALPFADFSLSSPTLDVRHNQLSCSVEPQQDVTYLWDMGDGSNEKGSTIQHNYKISNDIKDYTITLTATSKPGCTQINFKKVEVLPFIPNVFSPNGDGVNDLFAPKMELQVFDRFGLVLYRGTSGWDGSYQGKTVDPDTYFYLIRYTDKENQPKTLKGYITLVR